MSLLRSITHEEEHVADYSSRDYWDRRFHMEDSFEWLQPLSSIVPFIQRELKKQTNETNVKLLHIGCGSSELSNELRRLGRDQQPLILNVDFSPGAVELGQKHELHAFGDVEMGWAVVDLLDWAGIRNTCSNNDIDLFDIVIEKSCSDAIACGSDVKIVSDMSKNPESPHSVLQNSTINTTTTAAAGSVSPEIALAVYLGRITRPGAVWIALSYSSSRFDYLKSTSRSSGDGYPDAQLLWAIEQENCLSVASNSNTAQARLDGVTPVYRPEIFHYVYVLRRKDL